MFVENSLKIFIMSTLLLYEIGYERTFAIILIIGIFFGILIGWELHRFWIKKKSKK